MFVGELKAQLKRVLKDLQLEIQEDEISFEHPAEGSFGDYSTNVALASTKYPPAPLQIGGLRWAGKVQSTEEKSPRQMADEIACNWRKMGLPDFVEKVEVAGPGFINIWLKIDALGRQLTEVLDQGEKYGSLKILADKKILLEHTSPNPQTTIMLGHLRNNFLGMSVGKILEFCGAKVVLDDVVNDRGVHLCRSMWGYLIFCAKKGGFSKEELLDFRSVSEEKIKSYGEPANWREALTMWVQNPDQWWRPEELGLKSDHANLIWYVLGSGAYKLLPQVENQVEEILQEWEKKEEKVRRLWQQILDWSDKGYAETYQRIGSCHDWVWRESSYWQQGREIVKEGMQKGVFRESEGAVVTDLAEFGLPDNVVVKSDGTALYITQDLALTKLKKEKFPSDLYIWDIGAEQTLYFKQLFTVVDQLGIIEKEKLFHLSYSLINFKGGGKMSTRKGSVITADEVLDELHFRAKEIIKTTNQELRANLSEKELESLAEKVAIGAVKYSLLKYGRETTIFFDFDESLALQGNSGPYLQYTYARTQSVLRKAQSEVNNLTIEPDFSRLWRDSTGKQLSNEEISILRMIYRFPEMVEEVAQTYSPNLICNFLFDLAQRFNLFYDKQRIIGSKNESLRLLLTAAVGQVIKNGLTLLEIEVLQKM